MFYLLKEHNGATNVGDAVEIIAAAGTYPLCSALTSAGALATGSAKAEYLCMEGGTKGKTLSEKGALYCIHVSDEMVFETELVGTWEAAPEAGKAYQFSSDGTTITPTTATAGSGAVVLHTPDTYTEGTKVRVKLKV